MNLKEASLKKLKLLLVSYLIDPLVRGFFRFSRLEIHGLEAFKEEAKQNPVLLSLWHEKLLIMPYLLETRLNDLKVCAVTSKSRDGELLETLKNSLPNVETIRVSHNSRHGSLKGILSALKALKTVVITPDGPQGPWKELKPGLLQTSAWTKTSIWCLSWSCQRKIYLPTQDRMQLPLPFQKIVVRFEKAGIYQEGSECFETTVKSLLD